MLLPADGEVKEFPIIPIDPKDIIDTNGAGDAFVGGRSFDILKFLTLLFQQVNMNHVLYVSMFCK